MGIKELVKSDFGNNDDKRTFLVDWDFSAEDAKLLPSRRDDLAENPFLLKLFHVNDLHCNIYGFDDTKSKTPIFSKIVNEVEKERALTRNKANAGVLFLSAGDDSIGTPLDHLTGYDGENFVCHPVYSAFSLAGIDATVLGNHDFDAGIKTLKKSISEDANFPVLSANLEHNGELDGIVYPGAIIVVKGIRIGLVGLTTPGQIRSREGSFFSIVHPLETLEKIHDKLVPFCDSIIVLSHLGYKLGSTFAAVKISGDVELASNLDKHKVDVIVGGHTHDFLNITGLQLKNIVNDIPILQAGYNGIFLGRGLLEISSHNRLVHGYLVPTGSFSKNLAFDTAYEISKTGKAIEILKDPVGNLDIPDKYDTSYFEIFKNSLENPMANFITDALTIIVRSKGFFIDLALIDGTSMITFFDNNKSFVDTMDVYRLMPYADTIVLLTLPGQLLTEIIKGNVLRLDRDDKPNIERGFLHFSRELRYRIDKKTGKTFDIKFNNTPFELFLDKSFTIAMPNYVQGLARSWEKNIAVSGQPLLSLRDFQKKDTGLYVRNGLLGYIRDNGVTEKSGFKIDGRLEIS